MMRPRWRKVFSDLISNLVRSLLIIVSIAVGLVAVGMIVLMYHAIGADMREGYAAVIPAHITVRTEPVDEDYLGRLRRIDGVAEVQAVREFDLRVRSGPEQFKTIRLKAYDDIKEYSIGKLRLVEGVWPPRKNEIVIDQNRLQDIPNQIGEKVEIKLGNGEIRSLKLVGIVQDQTIGSNAGGAGFFLAPVTGYIDRKSLEYLGQPDEMTMVQLRVDQNENDLGYITTVAERVTDDFKRNDYTTYGTILRRSIDHPNAVYVDAMKAVLYMLGFLVVFLSGFLIINTLTALLNQQIQQIGVMKTVGATRAGVIGIYLALVLVYSALALAIAIPISNLVAFGQMDGLAKQLNFIARGFRFVPQSIQAQVIIALIVPQAAALWPVLVGTGLPIQQALSGVSSGDVHRMDRFTRWLAGLRLASRPLAISLRNTFRRRMRLLLTIATLALGGAIFIGTFNMRAALEDYIDRLGRYFIADVNVTMNEPYRISEVTRIIRQEPGVKTVEGWAITSAQLMLDGKPGENVLLQGPPVNSSLIEPIVIEGRWLLPEDKNALALNEVWLTQFPEIKTGSEITLRIQGKDTRWTVVGFYQFAGKNIGLTAFTHYDALAKETHTSLKSLDFRITSTNPEMTFAEQEALAQRLETRLNERGLKVQESRAGLSIQNRTTGGLDTLTNFLLFLSMLMATVGSIGLTGTMSLNVLERTREIGVMRAVGASDGEVFRIVLVEGLIIGLISWVVSFLAAFPVSAGLSQAIGLSIFGSSLPFRYVMTGPLIWLLVMAVFSVFASILPARRAVRLTIREILAYE